MNCQTWVWVIISASVMADLAKHSVTPLTARKRMSRHCEKYVKDRGKIWAFAILEILVLSTDQDRCPESGCCPRRDAGEGGNMRIQAQTLTVPRLSSTWRSDEKTCHWRQQTLKDGATLAQPFLVQAAELTVWLAPARYKSLKKDRGHILWKILIPVTNIMKLRLSHPQLRKEEIAALLHRTKHKPITLN